MSIGPLSSSKVGFRKSLGSNETAISGTDTPGASVHAWNTGRTRFVPGWVCTTSGVTHPGIHHFEYISPEAMITGLSVLTRLKSLKLEFESPQSRPDQKSQRPPPPTRNILPVLTLLEFKGANEYLEDFVARIDAPLLDDLKILFFHQPIFYTSQLGQFISRTPNFEAQDEARVAISNSDVRVTLRPKIDGVLKLVILCDGSDLHVSSLVQVCSSSFAQAFIPAVERLYIFEDRVKIWQDDMENARWLELLRPFTAVKELYMSWDSQFFIAPILQELAGERVTEVLPALQTLFLEERFISVHDQEVIEQYVASRQLAGHPIVISRWEQVHSDHGGDEDND